MKKTLRPSLALLGIFGFWGDGDGLIRTHHLTVKNVPTWLKERQVSKVAGKMESFMEWTIKPTQVTFHTDESSFSRTHDFGSSVVAITVKSRNQIHLGPRVTPENFEGVLGHELVHAIIGQKYKSAIPLWLEEGLANYASKINTVDYKQLAARTLPRVEDMGHPFKSEDPQLMYQVSTALMEMLAKNCNFRDLLQMSVGKKLEQYLKGICGIENLDAELKKWIDKKAKG